MIVASHFSYCFNTDSYKRQIDLAVKALQGYEFDAIAFRGMSGALAAAPVAYRLKKKLILVRKENDDTHSDLTVEGDTSVTKYIIADDFTCSGDTKKAIIEKVKRFAPNANYVGLLEVKCLDKWEIKMYQQKGELYPLK